MESRHADERLATTEPKRARQIVLESRDLVARTREAVARSRKLLDRLRRKGAGPAAQADSGPVRRNSGT
jgi:hypothetical protein